MRKWEKKVKEKKSHTDENEIPDHQQVVNI